jgi:DNA excision repair protein ERCC-3
MQVITSLPPADTGADLSYHKLSDQLDLLSKVLSAGDEAAGIEQLDEDMDDITRNRFTRTHGNMSTISGSDGRFYMEYSTGRGRGMGRGQLKKARDPNKPRNQLFKKRFG